MDVVSYAHSAKQSQRIEKFIENPDSNSGIVTFPKVIEVGETVTIKSGRQAILADTVIDGNLVIEAGGDVFVPAGAGFNDLDQRFNDFDQRIDTLDNTTVKLTGNETIAGVKTFSSSPIVPTPTTDFQGATKKYVDDIISNIQTLPIGAILNGYTIFDNCIVAFGGVFNRADYPNLWAYLQVNSGLVATEANWWVELSARGGICGYFSSGNGTTTFRVPNLDKAFLRPDSRGVASYQGDELKSHSHTYDKFVSWSNYASGSMGGGYQTTPTSTNVVGGSETRPKNIAVLPLIVAK